NAARSSYRSRRSEAACSEVFGATRATGATDRDKACFSGVLATSDFVAPPPPSGATGATSDVLHPVARLLHPSPKRESRADCPEFWASGTSVAPVARVAPESSISGENAANQSLFIAITEHLRRNAVKPG